MYLLIINTYCMNKRGFHCALSFYRFSSSTSSLTSIPLSIFPPYYPGPLRILFPFHLPLQVSDPLPFQNLSLSSFSSTPLRLRGSVEDCPQKMFLFNLTVKIPKSLHCNLLIYLFKARFTLHKNMHWVPDEFRFFFVAVHLKITLLKLLE